MKLNKKTLLALIIAVVVVIVTIVVALALHSDNNRRSTAASMNTTRLDGLSLSSSNEVWRKSEASCSRLHLYDKNHCTTEETRVYTTPSRADKLKSALVDKFQQHGWRYYSQGKQYDLGGYFNSGNRSPITAEADVIRNASDKAIAIGGSNDSLSVAITDKVPAINQKLGNTYFKYSNPELEQEFKSTIAQGGQIYVVTSWAHYQTWS